MILGPKKLLQLVKKIKLVENLDKRELTTPEGAGFDIRLGEVHKLDGGKAYLGITHRETPKIKTVAKYDEKKIIESAKRLKQGRKQPTSVALEEQTVKDLKKLSQKKGVPYQILMRMFILEGLEKMKKVA